MITRFKNLLNYFILLLTPNVQGKDMTEIILNKNAFDIEESELLVEDVPLGLVVVSHKISREKLPVRFLYREEPSQDYPDSGWRFFSGYESEEYNNDPDNFSVYSLTRLANYQPEIAGDMLYSPIGSVFEKRPDSDQFEQVSDWSIPNK